MISQNEVKIWSLLDKRIQISFNVFSKSGNFIEFSPNGNAVITFSSDSVKMINIETQELINDFQIQPEGAKTCANYMIVGGNDVQDYDKIPRFKCWDTNNYQML